MESSHWYSQRKSHTEKFHLKDFGIENLIQENSPVSQGKNGWVEEIAHKKVPLERFRERLNLNQENSPVSQGKNGWVEEIAHRRVPLERFRERELKSRELSSKSR